MTFDQAQRTFRTNKTYTTSCIYLVIASQRNPDNAISNDTFFNAVGEVANWLSASAEQLRGFEIAKAIVATWHR
jgi:hypothetical protein